MANCLDIPKLSKKHLEKKEIANSLIKVKDSFMNDAVIASTTAGDKSAFIRFYNRTLPHLDFETSRLPNKKELKKLDRTVKNYIKDIYKRPTKVGELFKLPEAILRKNPATKDFFDSIVVASQEYRGNQSSIGGDLYSIKKYLNAASNQNGYMQTFGKNRSQASIEIKKLEKAHSKLTKEGKLELANLFYNQNLKDLSQNGNLSAANALYYLMLNPKLLRFQDYKKTKLEFGDDLAKAARIWHYGTPVKERGRITYTSEPLKERLWRVLGNGLNENIRMLKTMQNGYNKGTFKIEKLEQLHKDYFSKNAKERIKDYFPRQVLDIAPTFSKLSQDINSGFMDKSRVNQKEVGLYIDRMIEDVSAALRQPGSIYERSEAVPGVASKDVIGILDTYAQNAMRFNYSAYVTSATTKALKKLQKQEGALMDSHLQVLSEYVQDTHQSVLGMDYQNHKLKNIARSITSYQFMSKLGLNLRSTARNATQSLQNWVWFGTKGISKAMSDLKDPGLKKIVDKAMEKNGFEFVNIQELAVPKELLGSVEIDNTGKAVQSAASVGSKFNDYLENVARITGKPMQWVENKVNRGLTFKIAFLQQYNIANDSRLRRDIQKEIKRKDYDRQRDFDLELAARIENAKIKEASRYANNVVKELHYLYDAWAKPKALRSPVGAVLGQFSTYSINFFEYQRKILAKGGNDLMQREWSTPEAWRMYRLGMLYTFVTALSAATNTQWSNLVENDTYERIKSLHQYMTGDKEEKEKAFYGRGPVTATFGGPFVSDMLRIGGLINFNSMSGDDLNSYLEDYKQFHNRTGESDATEEIIRTLNTQMGRLIYTTGPRIIGGTSFPTVLGQELGLYKARGLEEWRDNMLYPLQKWTPKSVSEYFTPPVSKSKSKKAGKSPYTEEELQLIMQALDNVNI